ncbi:TPA: hypothetical protein DCR79_02360 [Patescibacteria group bacterium]|nr:hypothetical protein [Patescibacteria group bacterium]
MLRWANQMGARIFFDEEAKINYIRGVADESYGELQLRHIKLFRHFSPKNSNLLYVQALKY